MPELNTVAGGEFRRAARDFTRATEKWHDVFKKATDSCEIRVKAVIARYLSVTRPGTRVNDDDIEDVWQLSRIKLFDEPLKYQEKGGASLCTYLTGIAKNIAFEYSKQEKRRAAGDVTDIVASEDETIKKIQGTLTKDELAGLIHECLCHESGAARDWHSHTVSDRQRFGAILIYLGLSYRTISKVLSAPEGTLRSDRSRTSERLKSCPEVREALLNEWIDDAKE